MKKIVCSLLMFVVLSGCATNNSSVSSVSSSDIVLESSLVSSSISESQEDSSSEVISSIPREVVSSKYINAVYNNNFADPAIVRHSDGTFYAYSTGANIIKSKDLVNWESAGTAISRPAWAESGQNIWAPDVAFVNGQYIMYYSMSKWDDPNPSIGIATASHPEGPWTDRGRFFTSLEIGVNNSIDAQCVVDDGKVYLVWGSFRGNYIIRLTDDGLDFYDGSVALARENKIRIAGNDTELALTGTTFEGAYIVKRDEYYYFFGSQGACCSTPYSYHVRVGKSLSITGPYIDADGHDLKGPNVGTYVVSGSSAFEAPGHCSVIIDDAGDYWMLYHGYKKTDTSHSKRLLLLDKLNWDSVSKLPSVLGNVPSNNQKNGPKIFADLLS
jgi:arabinan endo-1,5-alpha-L-arabinosidase